ncbi:MAG: thiamine pyrophosphate-binding protein [Dehalococcoidia bacterium]|nr:thiamine pyrophosphate-binding protein [Dehalococcoidia bacterium]
MSEQLTGAQALAKALLKMGATRIYGIIGTSNVAFVDALYDMRDQIRYMSCRHEQVAASMADAEGRLTGRPGVVLVHSGPGALNALISAGNAYKDSSPMMIIAGAVKRRLVKCDGMLEVDHRRLFAPLCNGTFRVESTAEVPGVFSLAYRAAMSGARGPVLIEVPEDVWSEKAEIDIKEMPLAADSPPPISQAEVKAALEMLAAARLPLILSGAGVAYSHSSADLVRLAEALSLPVITTGNGRGTIPEPHPLCLGRAGFGGGNWVADKALEKCDALLCLGAGISDMTSYEFTTPIGAKSIMVVNISPECLAPQAPNSRLVLGDVADFLRQALAEVGQRREPPRSAWSDALAEARQTWDLMLWACTSRQTKLPCPGYVIKQLAGKVPEDTIVSVGAGMHLLYPMAYMPCRHPLTYLSTVNFGSMGFGLAAAMAAKLVYPDRTVVAVLGDGDFMMTMQDLETAVREHIDIKIVILNDFRYRVLNFRQRLQFSGRIIGTEHNNPDFAQVAKCFGGAGYRLDSADRVDQVLDAALAEQGLTVVDVLIDPDDVPPMNAEATLRMSAG